MLNLLLILFVVLSLGYIVCQLAERKDSRSHLINSSMFRNPYALSPDHNTEQSTMQHYCNRRGLELNEARYGNGGLTRDEVSKLDYGFTPILKS
ncbi:hypothetical protein [Flectobacillus roseus]